MVQWHCTVILCGLDIYGYHYALQRLRSAYLPICIGIITYV